MTNNPLDLFTTLRHISIKDTGYYDKLSDEAKKAFMPLVIQRWLTGTKDPRQIYFINTLVNPFVFSLHKHKELLYYLMTICGPGRSVKYQWKKAKGKHDSATPIALELIKKTYHYNTPQAKDAIRILSDTDILEIAQDNGLQKEELTKLKKELKSR